MRGVGVGAVAVALIGAAGWPLVSRASTTPGALREAARPASPDESPVYVAYFWRARPGRGADYSRYIHEVAEPIDEEARRMGAFEEVHTYTPYLTTGAPGTDWTHMRVFRLKNFAALDSFSARIDAATAKIYPDPEKRRAATSGRSADMRDLVRQEIWRDFR
ncbi:MAG TPA: hypothetical protein VFQ38_12980 [Longimicrobiales bacterium]|nr:hypothetical protein [Longimicrobiales bacterium]